MTHRAATVATAVAFTLAGLSVAPSASAAATGIYKNCTALHTKYAHGLGRVGAHDHTSGTPVTNFYRSTKLYKVAMSHNKRLDADKDGIACEK